MELSEEQEELIWLTGTSTTANTFFLYEFSGNQQQMPTAWRFIYYIWKDSTVDSQYKGRDGLVSGMYQMAFERSARAKLRCERDGDIECELSRSEWMHYPDGGWSHLVMQTPKEIDRSGGW